MIDVTYSLSNEVHQLYSISVKSNVIEEINVYISVDSIPLTNTYLRILQPKWQMIEFPILISELPSHAKLVCKFKSQEKELGLFNDSKLLRNGLHSLNFGQSQFPKLDELESKARQYERGEIAKDEQLDPLVIPKITKEIETIYSSDLFVVFQLPLFKFPVIYNEVIEDTKMQHFTAWYDPQIELENIIEEKHRRLVTRSGFVDKSLKPNAKARDDLLSIIAMPCTKQLSSDERDLIWTFRFFLSKNKSACSKFISSVYWDDVMERKEAIELLENWEEMPLEDALELLSKNHTDEFVRQFAVDRLTKMTDLELSLYLIQLVQAIKLEFVLYNGKRLPSNEFSNEMELDLLNTSPLIVFLIDRCTNLELLIPFYWHIQCELEDQKYGALFSNIEQLFFTTLSQHHKDTIRRQRDLVKYLSSISTSLKLSKEQRLKKTEWLREALADPKNGLNVFPSMIWLLNPSLTITGIIPDTASLFKSQLQPLKLSFITNQSTYDCIFKVGDDMRQDQLCLQQIHLMDKLLKQDNLDLKIKTYNVMAVGDKVGFAEFIESKPLSAILDEHSGQLLPFLLNPQQTSISQATMDTYIRSCAGYCIMTFILGVGDRHLENVLLTKDGHLFHVDYAYVAGNDPKLYPPFMKICREMVDLMGGLTHPNYAKFKQYCFTAYSILRKHAKLIIHLFVLMQDANLPSFQDAHQSIIKIQDKFRLDLGDKEAVENLDLLITESATALFPVVLDTIHRFAQYWRR